MGQFLASFLIFLSIHAVQAADVRHEVSDSPQQVTLTFVEQKIKTLSADEVKRRKVTLSEMISSDRKLYDRFVEETKIVTSSEPTNFIRSEIDNGLLGSMFVAYANHIPLTLRPDDVWLAITTSFAHYVETHAEKMRDQFVSHEDKEKLTVYMSGSLAMSDQRFWTSFTTAMLELMQKYTKSDLREWLTPDFSTSTEKDRLVGQIVMMGAMKAYFEFDGVLSSALTKLTLQGSLEDWVNLRARAEKLATYGNDLQAWSENLLPVLDQFVAAYNGEVNEDFWQRMITYRRLGSGGQKQFRGWFLVFAPFDSEGKYILNSKEEIEKTGIYATLVDGRIFHSTVSVPVDLDDNGTKHDLIFWGGVTTPAYDSKLNLINPSVDWAIVDKVKFPKAQAVKNIADEYSHNEYSEMPKEYQKMMSKEEFDTAVVVMKKEREEVWAKDKAKRKAEEAAKLEAFMKLPSKERAMKMAEERTGWEYIQLEDVYQKAFTKEEYDSARELVLARIKSKRAADETEKKADLLELPKEKLIMQLLDSYTNDYGKLDAEYKARFTQAEFDAALEAWEKERQAKDGWQ